jgi:hypothetical protein
MRFELCSRIRVQLAALAIAALSSAPALAGVVFNFSWTGDPALNAAIASSNDPTAFVTGMLELNVSPGQSFDQTNVVAASFTAKASASVVSLPSFVFDLADLGFLSGTVAGDGLSASLIDFFLLDHGADIAFGCASPLGDCSTELDTNIVFGTSPLDSVMVSYLSTQAAQASLRLTAVQNVVSVPATLALALLGLAAAARTARRRQGA